MFVVEFFYLFIDDEFIIADPLSVSGEGGIKIFW